MIYELVDLSLESVCVHITDTAGGDSGCVQFTFIRRIGEMNFLLISSVFDAECLVVAFYGNTKHFTPSLYSVPYISIPFC